ncbi:MAG: fimbria/pilus outer membrane usher protein [Pseudomonadota bacterium]
MQSSGGRFKALSLTAAATAALWARAWAAPTCDGIAFGEPKESPTGFAFDLPINLDGRPLGALDARVTAKGEAFVDPSLVFELIGPLLHPNLTNCLKSSPPPAGVVELSSISVPGITLEFDFNAVAINASIEMDSRAPTRIDLRAPRPAPELSPETGAFAFYLNAQLRQTLTPYSQNEDSPFRRPFTAGLNGAARIGGRGGVTIVADGAAREDASRVFQRGDVQAIYDWQSEAIRFAVGDVLTPLRGLQSAPRIGGLSIGRDFRLRPFEFTAPSGRRQFRLDRASTVTIINNGQEVRSFRLDPGLVDIASFPFVSGINDVQIIIEDDAGRRDLLDFTTFFDAQLLRKGLLEFGATAGFERGVGDTGRSLYDLDRPVGSFFVRRGITDSLTGGIDFQIDNDRYLAGITTTVATALGTFDVAAAYSDANSGGDHGYGVDLNYQYDFRQLGWEGAAQVFGRYASEHFGPIGNNEPQNPQIAEVAARVNGQISGSLTGTFGIRRSWQRDGNSDSSFIDATIARPLFGSVFASMNISYEDSPAREGFGALFSLRMNLGNQKNLLATHDTRTERSELRYRKTGANRVGELAYDIGLRRDAGDLNFNGFAQYFGNRFVASANQVVLSNEDDFDQTEVNTSFDLGASLAFADGAFAFGRPIIDSFAIVDIHKSLKDSGLEIDPSDRGPLVRSDRFGPIIVPDIQSYRNDRFAVSIEDAPIGYDTGESSYDLVLPFRSGARIKIGNGAIVSVLGTLVDESGEPISLKTGTASNLSLPDAEPAFVFTNRQGRFVLESLSAGKWSIKLDTNPPLEGVIEIGKEDAGLLRIPEITLKRGQK